MNIVQFTKDFFAMEKDLGLFDQRIDGRAWWDPVRHDVFYCIYYRLSGANVVKPPASRLGKRIWGLVTRQLLAAQLKLKLAAGRYDTVAFRAPRLGKAGSNKDLILDDILACVSDRVLVIDTFPHYYHVKLPAMTSRLFSSVELCHLDAVVRARFGCDVAVEALAALRFTQYLAALSQYAHLFARAAPQRILLVQNGIEKALFCAASEQSIPVIEVQHGLVNYVHPAYSYPADVAPGSLATLPTVFLTFADHWLRQCHYPVMHSEVVGNRQLYLEGGTSSSNDILVISADIYEAVLEEFVEKASQALPARRFVYKLHPNQFLRRTSIVQKFSCLANVRVIANEETLRELLHCCEIAVSVQSTAVYEALQAELSVYLIMALDYETHADVFDHPQLHLIRDADEFSRLVAAGTPPHGLTDLPRFFERFDAAKTRSILAQWDAVPAGRTKSPAP